MCVCVCVCVCVLAQSARAVGYIDCKTPYNGCPEYDINSSDAGALEDAEHPFINIAPSSTLAQNGLPLIGPYLKVKYN